MTMQLGSQTIVLGKTGFFNAPTTGLKGLIISNESPYTLSLIVGVGIQKTLYPETVDFFPTGPGFNGNVTYVPSGILTNPTSYTASTVTFDAVGTSENIDVSVYPLALTRPAVSPTATGAPIYTATWEVRSTVGFNQNLAVFNPANSGTILTFHSAKVLTNDTTLPTSNLIYWNANPNLPNGVNIVSHSGWNIVTNQGFTTSVATATADDDSTSFFFANRVTDILDMPANTMLDALAFPDSVILNPGVALILTLYSGASGHTIRLTLKWSENVQVSPIVVVGAKAMASSIQNDGSPLGTQWLEITPSGQGSSAIVSTVDGQLTWKVVSAGVYHNALRISNTGNFVQWGQAGDQLEILGPALMDQTAIIQGDTTINGAGTGLTVANAALINGLLTAAIGLIVNGSTNPTIDISAATGATGIKLQGGFNISGKHPAQLAGGTSGTADLFQICDGNFKIYGLQTNNFRTGASNQQIVFPTAFTTVAMFIAHDLEPTQLMVGATLPGLRQWSAFSGIAGTANSTVAAAQPINYPNIVWGGGAFDRIQFNSGWTAAHTAVGLLFGI